MAEHDHDHSNEPKVWCHTHQHEHVATIPRFTYQCTMCGFGAWWGEGAVQHERLFPSHMTYMVEHRTEPLDIAELRKQLDQLGEAAFQALVLAGEDMDGAVSWESFFGALKHPTPADLVKEVVGDLRRERDEAWQEIDCLKTEVKKLQDKLPLDEVE